MIFRNVIGRLAITFLMFGYYRPMRSVSIVPIERFGSRCTMLSMAAVKHGVGSTCWMKVGNTQRSLFQP
jgi:hypothetical protein